jgi:butyryl-CoA:acetate CoA-transferase
MEYMQEYKSKLKSADEAVKIVKSGDNVGYSQFAMTSHFLDEALSKRVHELKDVTLISGAGFFPPKPILADPTGEHFKLHESHFTIFTRRMYDQGMPVYYVPLHLSAAGAFYDSGNIRADVAFLKVGPMDKHGYFNLGVTNCIVPNLIDAAKKIIVEVNETIPRCLGGFRESIHISKVDYIVEGDNQPLLALPALPVSEADAKIAELIINEIRDGDCLQLGIGGMPNTIGTLIAKSDLKDLGVHAEMLCDAIVDIHEAGKLTNNRKQINPGKSAYCFAIGGKKLYDFMDDNPSCASFPGSYTNDPFVIAQNDNLISINNILEVDLFSQVTSETSGTRQVSGSGGQYDFTYGAYRSKGGKSFLCFNSTRPGKNGEIISRVKPIITPGGVMTVLRSTISYLVTEYGMTPMMQGLCTWERAEAIINIAHPDFRDDLIKEAQNNKIWRKSNKIAN